MKALKEKRNSFRSLWRMGLVILSVFALVFVACGDSNTGEPGSGPVTVTPTPTDPTNPQNVPGTPAKTVTRIQVKDSVSATAFSKEGVKPNLSGLTVDVWYSDGTVVNMAGSSFNTVPKIIGQAQLGSIVGAASSKTDEDAVPVDIYIYHPDFPSTAEKVTLPGVLAFQGYQGDPSGSGNRTQERLQGAGYYKVVGNNGAGVDYNGSLSSEAFLEDGPPLTPEQLGKIHVMVKYQGLYKDSQVAKTGANVLSEPSSSFEQLILTQDHLFMNDYTSNFLNDGTYSSANRKIPYAYGIDPDGYVNIPVSMGVQNGDFGEYEGFVPAKWNSTIYLKIPHGGYRYIRAIKLNNLTWGTTAEKPYILQTTAMEMSNPQWTNYLMSPGNIELEVSYRDTEETQTRTKDDFLRAVYMGRAGVYNEPVKAVDRLGNVLNTFKSPDDDDFGKIYIGYYSSLPNPVLTGDWRNPLGKGDYTNIVVEDVPIAMFVEGSGILDYQPGGWPKDRNPEFVTSSNNPGANMSPQELLRLQTTFDFKGDFVFETYAPDTQIIIPGEDFRYEYFLPRKPFVTTEAEGEIVEVQFIVPAPAIIRTGVNPAYSAVKQNRYVVFSGEEASFDAMVYPLPGDVH